MANGVQLATAYISLSLDAKSVQGQASRAGNTAARDFGSAYTRDVNGKLRDHNGRFVKDAGDTGGKAGRESAKRFGSESSSGLDKAGRESGKRFGSSMKGSLAAGAKGMFAPVAAAAAAFAVGGFLKGSISEAREAEKVGKTTTAIIKATGGAAKISADEVGALSTAISNKSGIDDEAIQSGANMLLTFKNVRNEVGTGAKIFDRATQAAVDLSAAGFGDVATTSKQLGKALNDPLKGIAALTKSGVTFTEGQKKQIKTLVASGKTLEAQKIILKEVESQVGGTAAASATMGEKFKVSFGNFKESIGNLLLPILDQIITKGTTVLNWLTGTFGPAFGQVFDVLFKGDFKGGPFDEDSPVIGFFFTLRDKVAPIITNIIPAIREIAGMLFKGDFTGVGPWDEDSGFVAFFFTVRDKVMPVIRGIIPALGDLADKVGGALSSGLALAAPHLKTFAEGMMGVAKDVGPLIQAIGSFLVGAFKALQPYLIAAAAVFAGAFFLALKAIPPILSVVVNALTKLFEIVKPLLPVIAAIGAAFLLYNVAVSAAGIATAIYSAITNTAAIKAKAMTAAQWLMNAALTANPIGLVVVAIVALVAGLVLAYQKSETFRNIVNAVWAAVKKAAKATVDWFVDTAWPAIKNAFQWIGDKATWLWEKAIKPAFDAIVGAGRGFYEFFRDSVWPVIDTVIGWLVAGFKLWWEGVKKYVGYVTAIAGGIFAFLRDTVWPVIQTVLGWIVGGFKVWWEGVKKYIGYVTAVLGGAFAFLRDTVWPVIKKVLGWILGGYDNLWQGIKKVFGYITGAIGGFFAWFRDKAWPVVKNVLGWIGRAFSDAAAGIGRVWDKIRSFAATPIEFVVNTVFGGLLSAIGKIPGLGGPMNALKSSMGIPIKFGGGSKPKAQNQSVSGANRKLNFAAGGRVPGYSANDKADNIPAWLTANEYVMPVRTVKHQGVAALDALRAGKADIIPRFADGGIVALGRKLQSMGWLISEHPAFGGVRPGHMKGSDHYSGNAIDINWPGESGNNTPGEVRNAPAAIAAIRAAGFNPLWQVAGHYNHLHAGKHGGSNKGGGGFGFPNPVDAIKSRFASMLGGITSKFGDSPMLKGGLAIGKQALEGLTSWAASKAAALLPDLGMTDGLVKGGTKFMTQETVKSVAARYGWGSGSQWSALSRLIQGESGWNPNAANPTSSARGLFQKLTSMHGPVEKTVAGQAQWGLNYIKGAYGNPGNALAKWQSRNPHWYSGGGEVKPLLFDSGGYLPTGTSLVHNATGKPEPLKRMDEGAGGDIDPIAFAKAIAPYLEKAAYEGTKAGAAQRESQLAGDARRRNRGR